MAYTIAELRSLVRQWARNANDPTAYSPENIDNAIKFAMDEFIRITKMSKQYNTITLTAQSGALGAFPTGFTPEFLTAAYLTLGSTIIAPTVEWTNYQTVLQAQAYGWGVFQNPTYPVSQNTAQQGQPVFFGFQDATHCFCYPIPDQAYVLNIEWVIQTPAWTSGGSGPSSWPLPDDALRVIAGAGAVYELQKMEPKNAVRAQHAKAQFEQMAKQFSGRDAGGTGPLAYIRNPPNYTGRL